MFTWRWTVHPGKTFLKHKYFIVVTCNWNLNPRYNKTKNVHFITGHIITALGHLWLLGCRLDFATFQILWLPSHCFMTLFKFVLCNVMYGMIPQTSSQWYQFDEIETIQDPGNVCGLPKLALRPNGVPVGAHNRPVPPQHQASICSDS